MAAPTGLRSEAASLQNSSMPSPGTAGGCSRVPMAVYTLRVTTAQPGQPPPVSTAERFTALSIRNGLMFAGPSSGNGPYASTDSGTSWTAANGGLTSPGSRSTALWHMTLLRCTRGRTPVFTVSTDSGAAWLPAKNSLTDTLVTALCATRGRLFAGTYTGMFLSTNSGSSWSALNNGLPAYRVASVVSIDSIILLPSNSGATRRPYKSTDWGLSWSPVSNGLSSNAVIQTLYVVGGNVFGGTAMRGVWFSTDKGESWSDISDGLSGPGLKIEALSSSGGYLFSGATKGGIWRRPLSEVVSVESDAHGVTGGIPIGTKLSEPVQSRHHHQV